MDAINEYDNRTTEKVFERFLDSVDDLIMEFHTSPEPDDKDSDEWEKWYDEEYAKVWAVIFPHIPLPLTTEAG